LGEVPVVKPADEAHVVQVGLAAGLRLDDVMDFSERHQSIVRLLSFHTGDITGRV
jgi:hypothetical protein